MTTKKKTKMNDDEYKIVDDVSTDCDCGHDCDCKKKPERILSDENLMEIINDFDFRAACVKEAIMESCADIDKEISIKFTGGHKQGKLIGVSIGVNQALKLVEVGIPIDVLSSIDVAKGVCASIIDSLHKIDKGETP